MADASSFFVVREWGCCVGASVSDVSKALGLGAGRSASFDEGVASASAGATFLVPHAGAVFIFARGIGIGQLATKLSSIGRSAYTIALDENQYAHRCVRAEGGNVTRTVAINAEDGFTDEGTPVANEPDLSSGELSSENVLKLAAAWGGDPVALVRASPAGTLA